MRKCLYEPGKGKRKEMQRGGTVTRMWQDYRNECSLNAHLHSLMCCADERDRVQKKTFMKWVNKHLIKVQYRIAASFFGGGW
ncbi:unnamed protein product [Oncorhynchus mykiss]|uniref:Uncharacterized protein n=1 Tax=Oncorhynchus mykiss TaxID=8022 RepID=A0A060WDR8_ONCMY|nr:unnamed protein product [Oncorhynchus mykiss]